MPAASKGLTYAKIFQLGLESVKGTLVPATHSWLGPVTIEPEDEIVLPRYTRGILGGHIPEDAYVAGTGTAVNFGDTPFSVEQAAYLYNMLIKAAVTSAGTTPFLLDNFEFPSGAASINDFSTFTFEWSDGIQEYEAGYGFVEKMTVHGDADANGGALLMSAVARARKRAASTITASLSPISLIQPLNVRAGTVKIDALGTAAGTAAATSNWLLSFSLEIVGGLVPDFSISGRADQDFAGVYYNGDHRVTGKLTCYMDATSVTQIANARTPTGIVMQLRFPGTGTRAAAFNLPISWTKDPSWGGGDKKGFHLVELEFEAGRSTTTTAQSISCPINMSASTSIT